MIKGPGSGWRPKASERQESRNWRRLSPRQKMKARAWQCIVSGCRNRVRVNGTGFECPTCKDRKWRAGDPLRAKWLNLKKSAKRRGHSFGLFPFERFRGWACVRGYSAFVPKGADALTVERSDPCRGYEWDNIECITNGENARRNAEFRRKSYVPYYQQMGGNFSI